MNCLLDTHTFLWAAMSPEQLSCPARATILNAANDIHTVVATVPVGKEPAAFGQFIGPLGPPSAPSLALFVNAPSMHQGGVLTLTAIATPGPTPIMADVYIALQLPGCTLLACVLFWQGGFNFTAAPQPILRNWPIRPFDGQIFSYTFGGTEPVGNYVWLGAFAVPGTLHLIGGIMQAPFTFSP